MARFSLQDETEAFSEAVVALVVPRFGNHWKERVQRLWDDVQERGLKPRKDSTKKLYMSMFRSAVRERLADAEPNEERRAKVDEALMQFIKIDPSIQRNLHEDYQARVKAQNADLVVVLEWKKIVEEFTGMLTHPKPEMRAIALMALTGRRFSEILQAAEFDLIEEQTKLGLLRKRYHVMFSGQAKTREAPNTQFGKTYEIPTLAPSVDIVRALRELRQSPEGRIWFNASARQLSTTFNPNFNRALKNCVAIKRLWPKGIPLTLKSLRALYAEIAYQTFKITSTRAPYFAKILGHGDEDLTTALSYMVFYIDRDYESKNKEEEDRLKEKDRLKLLEEKNRLKLLMEERREEAIAAKSGGGALEDDDGDEVIET